jgi:transcription elongation GreA/GreB family factor
MRLDKDALLAALVAQVDAEAETMKRAALATREAATHEEAKPENDKDTRSVEAAYLAGAQAERARELESAAVALRAMRPRAFQDEDPVALGAVVHLAGEDESELVCFLASVGGGLKARVAGREVIVVTPRSPMGSALVGQRSGDVVEVERGGRPREYTVTRVE